MSRRVLVVDDEASFRRMARRVLTAWGHVIVGEAGTKAEAIRLAAELGPDTVLADIALPDGDGFSLTAELLALPSPPRVVLTSADDDVVHTYAAVRTGARGFVPKDGLVGPTLRTLIESD